MGRVAKLIGIVLGALVLVFVAVLVAVALLFDPNDYKDDITAAVARATGRELTLAGDLELAVFPTIRIAVGEATLSNAPGFGDGPFARIGNAELAVALLPLLSGNVAIDEARLAGLELNLARDAGGRNNWQDLGGGAAAPADGAPAESGGLGAEIDLDVRAIEVADARVTWADAATGSRWELTNFDLEASDFGPNERFPLAVGFALAGADVAVDVAATMQATLTLAENSYRLDDLAVEIDGRGAAWPGGAGQAMLTFDSLAANLDAESIELAGLSLDFLGLTMRGSLSGQRLLSDLTLSGAVEIEQFAPREVLGVFGIELETADESVLASASARANLLYNPTQIGLRDMQLALDDSTLTGRVGLENDALRYDLAVDEINIDRYLPPATEGDAPENEGSLDEVDLPLDALRTLDASGELRFGRAQFSGLTLTDAAFALTAANGRLQLRPRAQLYGGSYAGDIRLDIEGDSARAALQSELSDVDLVPLGRDLLQAEDISGTGDVRLNVSTAGSNLGQMWRDLDGDVSFEIVDGALEGFDLWYELRRARARLDSADVPPRPEGARRTPFASLSASGVVADALLTNRDLTGVLDFMTITGDGTVNLLDDMIDFDLLATFVDSSTLQSDPAMADLAGQQLPLRATGTLSEPSILPDFAALVRARASRAVEESVEEERSEIQERIEEQREEAQDRVRDRLRNLLDRE